MKKLLTGLFVLATLQVTTGSEKINATFQKDTVQQVIPKEIYGHFAEHLGRCIYDGIWVGPDSPIPNINGYRKDIVEALKELKIPVLRWPGGCFADTYHWMDGVGPKADRPMIKNVFWGGTMEDNSFGTHEFFNLCELLECEPYLSANVGSGTVKEMTDWLEYITSDEKTPMAELRRKNGREKPWDLKYIGVGNESWGCGGEMTPEYYADLYRQYSGYCRLYTPRGSVRVACGANSWDTRWTNVVMEKAGARRMEAISVHYYTIAGAGWRDKGPSTDFEEGLYFSGLKNGLKMDELLHRHEKEMDKHDPRKRVELYVDEWGIWTDPLPGSVSGHLYQQNTLRDALIASTSLDIFHRHLDRVKMANIAQVINVLQAMVLTSGDSLVLTPTYHVFNMYKHHQEATFIPIDYVSPYYIFNGDTISAVHNTVSKSANGKFYLTFSNLDPVKRNTVVIPMGEKGVKKVIKSEVLTSKKFNDHNSFKSPETVKPVSFNDYTFKKGELNMDLPPMSVVLVEME